MSIGGGQSDLPPVFIHAAYLQARLFDWLPLCQAITAAKGIDTQIRLEAWAGETARCFVRHEDDTQVSFESQAHMAVA